jgi:hypothetical protein
MTPPIVKKKHLPINILFWENGSEPPETIL